VGLHKGPANADIAKAPRAVTLRRDSYANSKLSGNSVPEAMLHDASSRGFALYLEYPQTIRAASTKSSDMRLLPYGKKARGATAPRTYAISLPRPLCCPSVLDDSGPGPFLCPYPDQTAVWDGHSAAAGSEFLALPTDWAFDRRLEIEYPWLPSANLSI